MDSNSQPPLYTRNFPIGGATHTDDKQIIWLCRFWGEPFWVEPEEDAETRKKWWSDPDITIGGVVEAHYNEQDKKGVPLGHVTGTLYKVNKKYVSQKNYQRTTKPVRKESSQQSELAA